MNSTIASIAALMACLAAPGRQVAAEPSLYQPSRDAARIFAVASDELVNPARFVVRGQSPTYEYPSQGGSAVYPPTYAPEGMAAPGYQEGFSTDPWLGGGTPSPYVQPAPGMGGGMGVYGLNGPQPYRLGWTHSMEAEFLPEVGTSGPDVGDFGIFGVDLESTHTSQWPDKILSISPQFNYRSWSGPRGTDGLFAVSHLPGSVYRIGLDVTMATPFIYDWSAEVGFNPAVASDFQGTVESDAWLFDAHGVIYWRWGPKWMWAIGAAYWDRVDDIIIPYAGVVWTPNDFWELRLLFPESQISLFLGTPYGIATWAYLKGEYHVEAYQIELEPLLLGGSATTRVQVEDWRLLGGLKWEAGWMTSFVEMGWVFGRSVEFGSVGTDFDPDSGFIGRVGVRY